MHKKHLISKIFIKDEETDRKHKNRKPIAENTKTESQSKISSFVDNFKIHLVQTPRGIVGNTESQKQSSKGTSSKCLIVALLIENRRISI